MPRKLVEELFPSLTEEEGRDWLIEAYRNQGWQVKHLHALEPRFENGADFRAQKDAEVILAAVKRRPVPRDIPQLKKLAAREDCTRRLYFWLQPPTEQFMKGLRSVHNKVQVMGQDEIHTLLLEGEVTDYLLRLFALHPLVREMGQVLGMLWSCRATKWESMEPTDEELSYIFALKDATLKLRSALAVPALSWDEALMNKPAKDPTEYPEILDRALHDLDFVRRYVGKGLSTAFSRTKNRLPHILAVYWAKVRKRSFWGDFTVLAERRGSLDEVVNFATYFWLMPSEAGGYESARSRESIVGFYSSVVHIYHNLARVSNDLEVGVDWVLQERYPRLERATDADP